MDYAIEINNLTKHYDGFTLDHISFNLPSGCIMGFIGENGAGKTTTIKALLNLIHKDSGKIRILGKDPLEEERAVKEQIGIVLADQTFPYDFNAKEIRMIMQNIYQSWDNDLYQQYLNRFKLPEHKKIKALSKGMRMKLSIATALSHHPKLLILDEATSGLDPIIRNEILDLFQEFITDESHAVLMSSHISSDLEKIADYITFIHNGKLLFSEPRDNLFYNHGILKCSAEQFSVLDLGSDLIGYCRSSFGIEALIKDPDSLRSHFPDTIIDPPTLDDFMLFYTKGAQQ